MVDVKPKIKEFVDTYNKANKANPILVFQFVSIDSATGGKLKWWSYGQKDIEKLYTKAVYKYLNIKEGKPKRSLIIEESGDNGFLCKSLSTPPKAIPTINNSYEEPSEKLDPVGIDESFSNGNKNVDGLFDEWIAHLKIEVDGGSSFWVSLPHTDIKGRIIRSSVFVLFQSYDPNRNKQIPVYRQLRDFIINYLVDLYKEPLKEEIRATKSELLALKELDLSRISSWAESNPHIFISNKIMEQVNKIMPAIKSDIPILIIGKTGTGKEHIAELIHRASERGIDDSSLKKFKAINCSGYDGSQLVDSELFGHEIGAYTDAKKTRRGVLETFTEGTIFLDEIQQMPISVQKKLKRVLDGYFSKDKASKFSRLGSEAEIKTKARFIFAANQRIVDLVQEGIFLEDFFYRINVITISIPSLVERKNEIIPLAEKFLTGLNKEFASNGYDKKLTEGAKKKLLSHNYPGNVRDLRNVLIRAHVLSGATTLISETDLHFDEIIKHQITINLKKPIVKLTNSYIFQTVSDLYNAHATPNEGGSKKTLGKLVLQMPIQYFTGIRSGKASSKIEASAVHSFKSTWLNSKNKTDLEKIIAANKEAGLNLLPFIKTIVKTKKSKKK